MATDLWFVLCLCRIISKYHCVVANFALNANANEKLICVTNRSVRGALGAFFSSIQFVCELIHLCTNLGNSSWIMKNITISIINIFCLVGGIAFTWWNVVTFFVNLEKLFSSENMANHRFLGAFEWDAFIPQVPEPQVPPCEPGLTQRRSGTHAKIFAIYILVPVRLIAILFKQDDLKRISGFHTIIIITSIQNCFFILKLLSIFIFICSSRNPHRYFSSLNFF